jgi:hypothetical protein
MRVTHERSQGFKEWLVLALGNPSLTSRMSARQS